VIPSLAAGYPIVEFDPTCNQMQRQRHRRQPRARCEGSIRQASVGSTTTGPVAADSKHIRSRAVGCGVRRASGPVRLGWLTTPGLQLDFEGAGDAVLVESQSRRELEAVRVSPASPRAVVCSIRESTVLPDTSWTTT
jgi:hypothetical protein